MTTKEAVLIGVVAGMLLAGMVNVPSANAKHGDPKSAQPAADDGRNKFDLICTPTSGDPPDRFSFDLSSNRWCDKSRTSDCPSKESGPIHEVTAEYIIYAWSAGPNANPDYGASYLKVDRTDGKNYYFHGADSVQMSTCVKAPFTEITIPKAPVQKF